MEVKEKTIFIFCFLFFSVFLLNAIGFKFQGGDFSFFLTPDFFTSEVPDKVLIWSRDWSFEEVAVKFSSKHGSFCYKNFSSNNADFFSHEAEFLEFRKNKDELLWEGNIPGTFLESFLFSYHSYDLASLAKDDFSRVSFLLLSLSPRLLRLIELPFSGIEENSIYKNWRGQVFIFIKDSGDLGGILSVNLKEQDLRKSFLELLPEYFKDGDIYKFNFMGKEFFVKFQDGFLLLGSSPAFIFFLENKMRFLKATEKRTDDVIFLKLTPYQVSGLLYYYLLKSKVALGMTRQDFQAKYRFFSSVEIRVSKKKEGLYGKIKFIKEKEN